MEGHLVIFDINDTSKVWKKELHPVRDISESFEHNNATYCVFKPKPENKDKDNRFYTSHTDGSVRAWEFKEGQAKSVGIYPCNELIFLFKRFI